MKNAVRMLLACAVVGWMASGALAQVDGVKGTSVRPTQDEAKTPGCKIAKPGEYDVSVGDLIELDYTYPVVPGGIPKKVEVKLGQKGAVAESSLGIRRVVKPKLVGADTIAFYLDAKAVGEETVTVVIDGNEYVYKFKVSE